MFSGEANSEKDWWEDISELHKKQIEEGIDDLENDRVISSFDFWNILKNE